MHDQRAPCEQARGEGHLVDGCSGILSLRQRNAAIPKELERICLKALSKRAADRYSCAFDLAEDLRHWSAPSASGLAPPASIKIVPKGLRSFDANDSDFFLELLPGPRDRDGLPDSLRFWKTRLEETDPDKTFRVGLVYGPSGCGKSSLMKAGLLPRLADHVIRVFLEATPDQTEPQLLHGLRHTNPILRRLGEQSVRVGQLPFVPRQFELTPTNPVQTVRVLVTNFDPRVPSEENRKVREVFGWSDPTQLADQFIGDLEWATGGAIDIQIVEWREFDACLTAASIP